MADRLQFARPARNRASVATLVGAIGLWFALGMIQAHWIVLALFAVPPVLLAWDVLKNDTAWFDLTDTTLSFSTGHDTIRVPLEKIEKVRLNRRLDFSWRVTVFLVDGRKLRLPPPCQPPIPALEAALRARDIKIDHILFSFAG